MSYSQANQVTSEELKMVRDVLARLQDPRSSGPMSEGQLLQTLGMAAETPMFSSGAAAMTDASKRRADEPGPSAVNRAKVNHHVISEDEEDASFQVVAMPEKPRQLPLPTQEVIKLPEGIHTYDEWGDTICEMDRVKALELTYRELTENKDHHGYLQWVLDHGKSKGKRCMDLRNYLIYGNFSTEKSSGPCYPGSTTVRKTRPSK